MKSYTLTEIRFGRGARFALISAVGEHTPGPWHVSGPHDAPWVQTADCRTILPNTVADARLIAAAPDLLAALVRLVECPDLGLDELEPETCKACEQAREAIAKAHGE